MPKTKAKKTKKKAAKTIKRPVKKVARKTAKKTVRKLKKISAKKTPARKLSSRLVSNVPQLKPVGEVTHYFGNISVAIVKFNKEVPVGAMVWYKGATTDFKSAVVSMQYNHQSIVKAKKSQEVGIKVPNMVRQGDRVFLS